MIKIFTLKSFTTVLFIFVSFLIKAQNISFPDANFKQALVNNPAINTDGDTEISKSRGDLPRDGNRHPLTLVIPVRD